jgi:beta-galactosidase
MNVWEVPYAPGRLEAVGLVDGKIVSRARVETTGAPVALRLTPDRKSLAGDGRDAQPITVEALDRQGREVPTADLPLTFAVQGGRIIGLGNGDPTGAEPSKGTRHRLFNGLAQVIVQTDAGSRGAIRLTAQSPGVRSASISLGVRPETVLSVAGAEPAQLLRSWRQSPLSASRPEIAAPADANDMNSWASVTAGANPGLAEANGFFLVSTRLRPSKALAARGGFLDFDGVNGRAVVWVDNKLAARKTTPGVEPFRAPLAPGSGERVIVLLIEAVQGQRSGLPGVVRALPTPG